MEIRKESAEKEARTLWKSLKEKVGEAEAIKKFAESEEYKNFKGFSKDVQDFTETLKEDINANSTPIVDTARNFLVIFIYINVIT